MHILQIKAGAPHGTLLGPPDPDVPDPPLCLSGTSWFLHVSRTSAVVAL